MPAAASAPAPTPAVASAPAPTPPPAAVEEPPAGASSASRADAPKGALPCLETPPLGVAMRRLPRPRSPMRLPHSARMRCWPISMRARPALMSRPCVPIWSAKAARPRRIRCPRRSIAPCIRSSAAPTWPRRVTASGSRNRLISGCARPMKVRPAWMTAISFCSRTPWQRRWSRWRPTSMRRPATSPRTRCSSAERICAQRMPHSIGASPTPRTPRTPSGRRSRRRPRGAGAAV